MENNKAKTNSKNNKILKIFIILFSIIASIIITSIIILKSQLTPLYRVEYFNSSDDIIVQTYYKGEKINFPDTPTKTGYEFLGWSLDQNENNFLTQEILIEEELKLYAKWKEKSYTLEYNNETINLSCNSHIRFDGTNVIISNDNSIKVIPTPSQDGFKFIEWKISDGIRLYEINNFSLKNLNESNLTLVPIFKDLTVEFLLNETSAHYTITNLSHNNTIEIGDVLTFQITLNNSVNQSQLHIDTTDGRADFQKYDNNYFVKISDFNNNFKVYINNIELNKYTITYYNEEDVTSIELTHGDLLEIPNIIKPGYKLIGFKDSENRYYSKQYKVTSNLSLYAVWEEEVYSIKFPKNNGSFIIRIDQNIIHSEKTISKKYGETLSFSIELSNAYNNSDIEVYSETINGNIYPLIQDNIYTFLNISQDMNITINNIQLNSYYVYVDGKSYGKLNYGSWVFVDHNSLILKNNTTGQESIINTLFEDENFGGWTTQNNILVNCLIQDIANNSNIIEIFGNYSKKVSHITFISNGGNLEITEMIYIEGEDLTLPTPTKNGYTFAGWFIKLVEVNTIVDEKQSIKFETLEGLTITLYAGWKLNTK